MLPLNSSRSDREKKVITYKLDQIEQIAINLWDLFHEHRIWLFYGQVGSGKTTFIKQICQLLGVKDNTQSPTYSLINEYVVKNEGRLTQIYHIDLYRLQDLEEALELDIESYLDGNHHCFIEWPEIIEGLLPQDRLKLFFELIDFNSRKILIL